MCMILVAILFRIYNSSLDVQWQRDRNYILLIIFLGRSSQRREICASNNHFLLARRLNRCPSYTIVQASSRGSSLHLKRACAVYNFECWIKSSSKTPLSDGNIAGSRFCLLCDVYKTFPFVFFLFSSTSAPYFRCDFVVVRVAHLCLK